MLITKANKLYKALRKRYAHADALFEDAIISTIGKKGFQTLKETNKIEHCATFHGRKLYAL